MFQIYEIVPKISFLIKCRIETEFTTSYHNSINIHYNLLKKCKDININDYSTFILQIQRKSNRENFHYPRIISTFA